MKLDGYSFSADGAVEEEAVVFTTSDGTTPPTLTSLTPELGPLTAGTLIDVTGSHFAPVDGPTRGGGLLCKFGGLAATPASFVSATHVRCAAPIPNPCPQPLSLTLALAPTLILAPAPAPAPAPALPPTLNPSPSSNPNPTRKRKPKPKPRPNPNTCLPPRCDAPPRPPRR